MLVLTRLTRQPLRPFCGLSASNLCPLRHAHHSRFAQCKGLGVKVSDEFTVPLWAIHHQQNRAEERPRASSSSARIGLPGLSWDRLTASRLVLLKNVLSLLFRQQAIADAEIFLIYPMVGEFHGTRLAPGLPLLLLQVDNAST
jgi:hypothetical protein